MVRLINFLVKIFQIDMGKLSDGYHTFDELYAHRDALFLNLCLKYPESSWWSYKHGDGTKAYGHPWIIAGINLENGHQVSYHINTRKVAWVYRFRDSIRYVPFAPKWDGHIPKDVVERLNYELFYYGK